MDWAPYIGIGLLIRLYSAIRSTWVMLVVDNPLLWIFGLRGFKGTMDDIEGMRLRVSLSSGELT